MSSSDLTYVKVEKDSPLVNEVFEIIKSCGEDMFKNQGLVHWRNPYPMESIKNDCEAQSVFLVLSGNEAIATFMLGKNDKGIMLSKLAVIPKASGKGIGSACLDFAEKFCVENGVFNLNFNVYDKSQRAIDFYLKNGYTVYGEAPTRHFRVLLMEKNLK